MSGYLKPEPRQRRGGIKSQSHGGVFGTSWWARRWLAVLEGVCEWGRLSRGREYARGGQVVTIAIERGVVSARVQGSRSKPYHVSLSAEPLSAETWDKLGRAFAKQPLLAAKLLAGEMPGDIETAFAAAGVSLFPTSLTELHTECSCGDRPGPCEHIAAVFYLLAEELDRDPLAIFVFRGHSRAQLLASLRDEESPAIAAQRSTSAARTGSPEPLPATPEAFWNGGKLPDDFHGEVSIPEIPGALPRRLGSFPFWRGEEPFLDTLLPIYQAASPLGLDVFVGSFADEE